MIKKNKKRKKFSPFSLLLSSKHSGFSLVEMIVSMAIAVDIMLAVVAAFAGMVKARNTIRNEQQDLENARNAMDVMAKNLRMSFDVSANGPMIAFYDNALSTCVAYKFNSNTNANTVQSTQVSPASTIDLSIINPNHLCEYGSYTTSVSYVNHYGSGYSDLTSGTNDSGGVKSGNLSGLTSLQFYLTPNPQTPDTAVGKVTILMIVDGQSLQTTVSFRNYSDFQ